MNTKEATTGPINKICQPNFTDEWIDSCRKFLAQMESVKEQVKDEYRDRMDEHQHLLELAVNEAEALAWQTDFPELVFASLAAEKAHAVAGWHMHQRRMLQRA